MDPNKARGSPGQRKGFIPPRLEYRTVTPPGDFDYGPTFPGGMVFLGLMAGTVGSAMLWIAGTKWTIDRFSMDAVILVAAAKLITSLVLLFPGPRCRGFGLGMLLSMALGGLIFFCTCASHVSNV